LFNVEYWVGELGGGDELMDELTGRMWGGMGTTICSASGTLPPMVGAVGEPLEPALG